MGSGRWLRSGWSVAAAYAWGVGAVLFACLALDAKPLAFGSWSAACAVASASAALRARRTRCQGEPPGLFATFAALARHLEDR